MFSHTFSVFFNRISIFSAIKWSSMCSDAFKQRRTSQDSTKKKNPSWLSWKDPVILHDKKKKKKLPNHTTWLLKFLKLYDSLGLKFLQRILFLCLLLLLLPFDAFMQAADCNFYHPHKNTIFFQNLDVLNDYKFIRDFMFYIFFVYFEAYFDAGTCLDRILCQYLLCKSIIQLPARCLRQTMTFEVYIFISWILNWMHFKCYVEIFFFL